jgi:hypothetical protein
VNVCLKLFSPASYCQPSAAAGFVYLAFSWIHVPFVFSSIQPYPPFAIAVLFLNLQFVWGVTLPHSPVELSIDCRLPLLQVFPSPSTLGEVAPHLSSPAHLFIYSLPEGLPSSTLWSRGTLPSSTLWSRAPCPLCYMSLFFSQLLVYYSVFFLFFFTPLGGGPSVQGAMLI